MPSVFAKRLRHILTNQVNDTELEKFFSFLDSKVKGVSSEQDANAQTEFEDNLLTVFNEKFDFSDLRRLDLSLRVLDHSKSILNTSSVALMLFEPLLKPAIREPLLPSSAVETAKQYIIEGLRDDKDSQDMVTGFQRRVVDLFLLGVWNESGKDIFSLALLDSGDRGRNSWWKTNLQDILLQFGQSHPKKFLDILQETFMTPELRLQIIILLDYLAAQSTFIDIADIVFTHPFMDDIFRSLEIDNSSTVCAVELTLLQKILPATVIKAYEPLKDALPRLLGILGRVLCWKTSIGQTIQADVIPYSDLLDRDDGSLVNKLEESELRDEIEDQKNSWQFRLRPREELRWQRLERTFDMSVSSMPVPQQFFALLYFLFPCNLINFLRGPISFLEERGVESPWTVDWDNALDEKQVKTVGNTLLRSHIIHPSVIWHDRESELSDNDRWKDYDISRLIGECTLLDAQMFNLSGNADESPEPQRSATRRPHRTNEGDAPEETPTVRTLQLEPSSIPRRRKISLQDLIATSVALKTGAEINVSDQAPSWPSILFTPPPSKASSTTPSRSNSVDPTESFDTSRSEDDETRIPAHIAETISGLQREVLLLRTELNIELWIKRENVRHIRRLYKESIETKNSESEQLNLRNRLRDYRIKLETLQKETEEKKKQAEKIQNDNEEWRRTLESKRDDLRAQNRKIQEGSKVLEKELKDTKEKLEAQDTLLQNMQNKVSELEIQLKMDEPKIKLIRDYEARIEQCNKQLRMWASDVNAYNDQSKKLEKLEGENEELKRRIGEHEEDLVNLSELHVSNYQRIQDLEAELNSAKQAKTKQLSGSQQLLAKLEALEKENLDLRREKGELQEELDTLQLGVDIKDSELANWLTQLR